MNSKLSNACGKPSIFHLKNKKIEGIFQECLRFLDSKGTNGSVHDMPI